MQSRPMAIPWERFRISISQLIDTLSTLCIVIFSTREYVSRLAPLIPYTMLGYMLFALLIVLLLLETRRINISALLFFGCVVAVCVFNWLFSYGLQREYVYSILVEPCAFIKLWVYCIIFSLIREPEQFRKKLVVIAYINMALLMLVTISGLYGSKGRALNYLGLGISGAMWIPLIVLQAFITEGKRRAFYAVSAFIFIVFVAIYGNRGSLVAIIGFVIFCFLRYTKLKRKFVIASSIAIVTGIAYAFRDSILSYIISTVMRFGLFSRNINLLIGIGGQLSFTTNRIDKIWVRVSEAIRQNWVTGYGLCYDRVLNGSVDIYTHNLVLELFISFGVIFGLILFVIHIMLGYKNCISTKDFEWEYLFAPFYITSTLLLMFNNSFCLLSFFWIPYGVYFAYRKQKRMNGRTKTGGLAI